MNFFDTHSVWQAQGLPDGLSISDGIISGSPTAKGIFNVTVSVSNSLGSSSKNIRIITKYKPGFEKYSILQDGVVIDNVTMSQLRASVQDGSAQLKYNCTNTQIIIPLYTPEIHYIYFRDAANSEEKSQWGDYNVPHFAVREASYEDVAVNFCSFRNVTLQDGTVTPGLILQFDKPLWNFFAPFDTGDYASGPMFNRWRYSTLRQWLNSSGDNWFSPAYEGDALIDNSLRFPYPSQQTIDSYKGSSVIRQIIRASIGSYSYADSGSKGFLDFLPDDLSSILQPVRIVTQVFFDDNNDNQSIDDPDYLDGVDVDITYDKVFIPSLSEMFLRTDYNGKTIKQYMPQGVSEGLPWEFYINRFYVDDTNYGGYDDLTYLPVNVEINNNSLDTLTGFRDDFSSWGHSLAYDFNNILPYTQGSKNHCFQSLRSYPVLSRSPSLNDNSGIWCLEVENFSNYYGITAFCNDNNSDLFHDNRVLVASPAPAFVLC